jgi:nucleoside-diphosphate-sugar epimerase
VNAVQALESAVLGVSGLEGVVLRYGYLYGPGTWYSANGSAAADARARRLPIVDGGTGTWSWLHVDDAAAAAVRAVEGGPSGVYNVCDDHPAPVREWLPAFAEAVGAPPPRRVPTLAARMSFGSYAVYSVTRAPGASNTRAREQLGWTPKWADWRTGFRDAL